MTIDELYRHYRGHIFYLCRKYIHDPVDTDDVVQMVFLKAWQGLGKFECRSGHFTWLYRIAVHECLNYLKRRKCETIPFDETKVFVDDRGRFSTVEKCCFWNVVLNSIDRKERMIIFLYAVEGLTMTEIADITGISRQAIHKKWTSIMKRLAKKVRSVV